MDLSTRHTGIMPGMILESSDTPSGTNSARLLPRQAGNARGLMPAWSGALTQHKGSFKRLSPGAWQGTGGHSTDSMWQ